MSKPYLEITYRAGKPLAAYLYLPRREGDKVARTDRNGRLLVDYSSDGRLLGIELTQLPHVDLAELNRVLAQAATDALSADDLSPLRAA